MTDTFGSVVLNIIYLGPAAIASIRASMVLVLPSIIGLSCMALALAASPKILLFDNINNNGACAQQQQRRRMGSSCLAGQGTTKHPNIYSCKGGDLDRGEKKNDAVRGVFKTITDAIRCYKKNLGLSHVYF
jgi:hypothetical protein